MTREQLDRANKLSREIQEMTNLVGTLGLTIEMQQDGYRMGKPPMILKSMLRFCNGRKKDGAPEEARIILFRGLECEKGYGFDIPVDVKVIELLRAHFAERLKEMEAEFANLSKED